MPFVSKAKTMNKADGPEAENFEWIKLKFLMDKDYPASKYF
jgi:hypothetical protein